MGPAQRLTTGFKFKGLGFRVWAFGFCALVIVGSMGPAQRLVTSFQLNRLGFRVWVWVFWALGLGFRVWGFGAFFYCKSIRDSRVSNSEISILQPPNPNTIAVRVN